MGQLQSSGVLRPTKRGSRPMRSGGDVLHGRARPQRHVQRALAGAAVVEDHGADAMGAVRGGEAGQRELDGAAAGPGVVERDGELRAPCACPVELRAEGVVGALRAGLPGER